MGQQQETRLEIKNDKTKPAKKSFSKRQEVFFQ